MFKKSFKKSNPSKKIGKSDPKKTSPDQMSGPPSDPQEIINELEAAKNSLRTVKENFNQIV
ncbi:MAG: hypothetical protein V3U16_08815, partial [Candidatus Neomarinimicrobiota bacterium]